jgi:hypothetical protein
MAKQKKPDANFKFYVGSLLHENPNDYVAICNQFGEITGHLYNGTELKQDQQEEIQEPIQENPNQLLIF